MTKEKGTDQFIEIAKANARLAKILKPTPLFLSRALSKDGTEVYFKLENMQPTGSFKIRGAANKLLSMMPSERKKGVVTASTGNHGASVGYMCKKTNAKGTVFAPSNVSQTKYENMISYGLEVIKIEGDAINGENAARKYAQKNNIPFISPYNDVEIVAGQGTIGFELFSEITDLDAVFISLGGGGLVSGIAIALANLSPKTKIIACSAKNSKVMMVSVSSGKILDIPSEQTLSDGTAGGVEQDTITFEYCRNYVDEFIDVNEEEIVEGMRFFFDETQMIGEGSVGVAVAGYLKQKHIWKGKKVSIIACGRNISRELIKQVF